MKKIRTGFAAALFVFLIGGVQACTSPTAPTDDDPKTQCTWIGGILHCSD